MSLQARYYVTTLILLLGGSFAGLYYLDDPPALKGLILCVGGGVGILIALFGRSICDQYYKRMLEAISSSAKLESLFGLTDKKTDGLSWRVFSDDPYLIPTRWVENLRGTPLSTEFVQRRMHGGSNRVVQLTLWVFAIVNSVMLISGLLHIRLMYMLFDNPWMAY